MFNKLFFVMMGLFGWIWLIVIDWQVALAMFLIIWANNMR